MLDLRDHAQLLVLPKSGNLVLIKSLYCVFMCFVARKPNPQAAEVSAIEPTAEGEVSYGSREREDYTLTKDHNPSEAV
jgi:hypothetical protein